MLSIFSYALIQCLILLFLNWNNLWELTEELFSIKSQVYYSYYYIYTVEVLNIYTVVLFFINP